LASVLSTAAIATSKIAMASGGGFNSIEKQPLASRKQIKDAQSFGPVATTIRPPQEIEIKLGNAPYEVPAHDAARAERAVVAEPKHMPHLVHRSIWFS